MWWLYYKCTFGLCNTYLSYVNCSFDIVFPYSITFICSVRHSTMNSCQTSILQWNIPYITICLLFLKPDARAMTSNTHQDSSIAVLKPKTRNTITTDLSNYDFLFLFLFLLIKFYKIYRENEKVQSDKYINDMN